jgi:phenylalanine-4-hydroxylase
MLWHLECFSQLNIFGIIQNHCILLNRISEFRIFYESNFSSDIVHELMGHAPMFANPDFADFSQEIGLASLGASDEQIVKLGRVYWFTVEFGLCSERGQRKAIGAGLLSSFGELEYSMGTEPSVLPWDPYDASQRDYPISTFYL